MDVRPRKGIKLHNLIFLGMAVGALGGVGLYYLDDYARMTPVTIKATFQSDRAATGTLQLLIDDVRQDLNGDRRGTGLALDLTAGRNEVELRGKLRPETVRELRRHTPGAAQLEVGQKLPAQYLSVVFVPGDRPPQPAVGEPAVVIAGIPHPTLRAISDQLFWWLNLFGPTVFISALKMIIAPLIFASIVAGVTSLPNMRELGSIGWKTLAYYVATTAIAVTIGLVCVLTIQPGRQPASHRVREERAAELAVRRAEYQELTGETALLKDGVPRVSYLEWLAEQEGRRYAGSEEAAQYSKLIAARGRSAGDMFKEDIILPLLTNPFTSLAASPPNALGLIFFALLLGVACTVVGAPARPVISFFHGLNAVILKVTHWLMLLAPFAIMCIVAWLVGEKGPIVFVNLGWYCGTVIGGILIHVALLLGIAYAIGGVGPLRLWRGLREAWMIAFTTRSSAATLPVTLSCVTRKLNVSPKVANFSLPIGATINMDGTALYEGVAVIFLIQIYGGLDDVGITMTAMATFLIFITAVLASVGAAAVPDAGLVTMVLVASAVHLPVYYIPMIFAVDAFLDMFRTSTNVLGDSVGAIVVNRLERERLGDGAAA
jgi:Na+/H+-dicarboxylate symporter